MKSKCLHFMLCFVVTFLGFAQKKETTNDSLASEVEDSSVVIDTLIRRPIDPLRPSKAAFYSAILPGLGQAYNKKYWKIPIVWAAIGTGIYFYVRKNNELNRYRDAFKRRLAGFTDDEFYGSGPTPLVSMDGLERAQQLIRRDRDLSLLITIGLYALNIIDANVDAHLMQFNVDKNLSLRPHFQYNQLEDATDLGLTLNLKF